MMKRTTTQMQVQSTWMSIRTPIEYRDFTDPIQSLTTTSATQVGAMAGITGDSMIHSSMQDLEISGVARGAILLDGTTLAVVLPSS